MLIIWAVVLVGYAAVRYVISKRWQRKKKKTAAVPIAHSDRLTGLQEYQLAIVRYRQLLKTTTGALFIGLLMAVLLSARPAITSVILPAQKSRDIMLCLDVSGSLLRVDTTLVNRFGTLVNNFSSQRFGMTVFNSSSISIIPLTDDYQLINAQLLKNGKALSAQKGQAFTDLTSGTLADFDKGTSLVGDGLMSCINNLGENAQLRSQSIILATDNETNGTSIVALQKAATIMAERNVRLYVIDPAQGDPARSVDHEQLKTVSANANGKYYQLSDKTAVNDLINDISKQEAKYAAGAPIAVTQDKPKLFFYIACIVSATALVFIRRLRL